MIALVWPNRSACVASRFAAETHTIVTNANKTAQNTIPRKVHDCSTGAVGPFGPRIWWLATWRRSDRSSGHIQY